MEVVADLSNGIHHFGQSPNISLSSTLFSQQIVYHALQSYFEFVNSLILIITMRVAQIGYTTV